MGLFDIVDGALGTDLTGKKSARAGLRAQTQAANQANQTTMDMYNQNREDQQPWMDAGKDALGQMQGDQFHQNFTMNDFQADPGYAFRMAEGQKAIERSAAARGGLNSGATMKSLAGYQQGMASQEYNNAYNRFNNDRDSSFNKFASLAGLGQSSTGQMGNLGANAASQVAGNQMGLGNAAAAGIIGANNNMNNLIGQGAGAVATFFSDERLKENITPISKEDLKELRQTIRPYFFNYKDENHGKGDWAGVMAQDLEKSKLGKYLVSENSEGHKYIDTNKAMSLLLATMAEGA